MLRIIFRSMLFISFLIFSFQVSQAKNKTENIILITLDGMRWQEVFQGQ
jgi:hypothetical protein